MMKKNVKYLAKNDDTRSIVNNDEGATSVLVIFMMIVLVTLGTFAITSSNVNYKLSLKTINWSKEYYTIDSKAEMFKQSIDNTLITSENSTIEYLNNNGFKEENYVGIDNATQTVINETWNNTNDKNLAVRAISNSIYYYYVEKNLNSIIDTYPGVKNLVITDENSNLTGITSSIDFKSDNNEDMNLRVEFSIKPFNYNLQYSNDRVSGKAIDFNRLEVLKWSQWNTEQPIDINIESWPGLGFEDDSINSENDEGNTDIFGN